MESMEENDVGEGRMEGLMVVGIEIGVESCVEE